MKIYGLQKLSLLDFPGKLCCTVFTGGCNFRCPFCHNASLVVLETGAETMDSEDLLAFLATRRGLLDGVCVTGGEPALQPGLLPLLSSIKELGFAVKLDTNGSVPDVLREAVNRGLVDYVAMDVKNCLDRYAETVGLADYDTSCVKESISFLLEGKVDYEFRTTVTGKLHTEQDIRGIGELIAGARRAFLQCYVNSGNILGGGDDFPPDAETLQHFRNILAEYVTDAELRGV